MQLGLAMGLSGKRQIDGVVRYSSRAVHVRADKVEQIPVCPTCLSPFAEKLPQSSRSAGSK